MYDRLCCALPFRPIFRSTLPVWGLGNSWLRDPPSHDRASAGEELPRGTPKCAHGRLTVIGHQLLTGFRQYIKLRLRDFYHG